VKPIFVGIPTINRPMLVRETIDSVLGQTCRDLRAVVSDNGSEPEAIGSVRDYIAGLKDDRIEFVAQSRNDGEYGQARYFFARAADFRYFMMVHDDDVLKPDYVEKGIAKLDSVPEVDVFLADPYIMDEAGNLSNVDTSKYLADHGRIKAQTGPIDVLTKYVMHGFLPISGTMFRRSALERSGFVDSEARGNFPFECDVFLRLADIGAAAWYQREELLGFRFHRSSMRNYMHLMQNRQVVDDMVGLFSKYRYRGAVERRRRAILSRLHRANAVIGLRVRDIALARSSMVAALKARAWSPRAWAMAPFVMLVPRVCSRVLRSPPAAVEAPAYRTSREGRSSPRPP